MTNAAAVIALTYRGTDIQQNPFGIFLEIIRGLNEVAATRGVDHVVPALTGRVLGNRIRDTRAIELRGWVAGIGADEDTQRADFRGLVQELQSLFDPTVSGALEATLEDGTVMTIAARTIGDGLLWNAVVPALSSLSVRLESLDPEWAAEGS